MLKYMSVVGISDISICQSNFDLWNPIIKLCVICSHFFIVSNLKYYKEPIICSFPHEPRASWDFCNKKMHFCSGNWNSEFHATTRRNPSMDIYDDTNVAKKLDIDPWERRFLESFSEVMPEPIKIQEPSALPVAIF